MPEKIILDACCGGKQFWIDKENKHVLFIDIRKEPEGFLQIRPKFKIEPDIILDFKNLPFKDNEFKLVVWDPPHILRKGGQKNLNSIMKKKYGALDPETWKNELTKGFNELWRVLDDYGTLIFKFNNTDINFNEVLELFHTMPLFGTNTKTTKNGETKWFCFMKIPGGE